MYILEGNIGAGKSTFLKMVATRLPEVSACQEPVDDWQKHVYGQSLLANFYEQPKRWAYTFELLTMMHRVQEHIREQKQDVKLRVIERSIYSGFYCFAFNSFSQEFMSPLEWKMYNQWFEFLVQNRCQVPRGFIYLKTTPEVAYERIKKRNRYAEKTVSLAYLRQIHERHEQFLIKKQGILKELFDVPVLVLSCDNDFEHNMNQLHTHIHAIQRFFAQTGSLFPEYKYQHSHSVG